MLIRYGFDIQLELHQASTLVTAMDVHPSRQSDVVEEGALVLSQPVAAQAFIDEFGNRCRRISAEPGSLRLQLEGAIRDTGEADAVCAGAGLVPVTDLPPDTLPFLRASRYCETDLMTDFAWRTFGGIPGGWGKVQAICDFVHRQLRFSYPEARETRTAVQAFEERTGVCRDFTHLAVTLCRCLNIPARYCNGYLGDIGVPPATAPMDFNAWFEAYLEGGWFTFDARHNEPRIGRILIAQGRDAADIAMITSFGTHSLGHFTVTTEEVSERASAAA